MYYVTMTDKFMSGWGHAQGKINKLVIAASTYDRAMNAYNKAKARSEMRYVNITDKKPYYTNHHVSRHGDDQDPPDYQSWLE